MVGNIYKQDSKRIKVEKKIGFNRFTCKEWFSGMVITTDKTEEQLKKLELICTLNETRAKQSKKIIRRSKKGNTKTKRTTNTNKCG